MTKWDSHLSETDICINCVYWVPCFWSDDDYGICESEDSDHSRHVLGASHVKCKYAEEHPQKENPHGSSK